MQKLGDVLRDSQAYKKAREGAPTQRATQPAKPRLVSSEQTQAEVEGPAGSAFKRLEALLENKPEVLTRTYVRTPVAELVEVFEALETNMGDAQARWAALGRLPHCFQKPASYLPLRYILRWKDLRGSSDWTRDLYFLELVYLVQALGYRRVPGKRPA